MECDKCKSENTEEIKRTQALHEEYYVEHVQWLVTRITFKCRDCGHEFEEEF